MGVYIKGMDMPKSCGGCVFNMGFCCKRQWDDETHLIRFESNLDKRNNCPFVEVKAPHGRLIDENAVMREFAQRDKFSEKTLRDFLMEALTIIEAEVKDDD